MEKLLYPSVYLYAMAKMIPSLEPRKTQSQAELKLYQLLRDGLSEDFTVIHSLPWLCKAAKEININGAPTGEIDFIILHPKLGGLLLEIKGGRYKICEGQFISQFSDKTKDPVHQLRSNVHGIAAWLTINNQNEINTKKYPTSYLWGIIHISLSILN